MNVRLVDLQDGYDYLARTRRAPFIAAGGIAHWYPEGHYGAETPACQLPGPVYQRLSLGGMHRREFATRAVALEAAARAAMLAMRAGEIPAPARERQTAERSRSGGSATS